MTSKKLAVADETVPYALKPREEASYRASLARREKAKPLPKQIVKIEKNSSEVSPDHPDLGVATTLAMEALGLARVGQYTTLMQQVAELTQKDGNADESGINQMLAQIAAVEPKDGIEAMLATQMAVVHNAMLKSARSLRASDTIPQQDSNGNLVNKLARTFATQVEALKRYRTGGQQRVVVEHVTVNGGQAIVGNVETGGGGSR